MSASAEIQKLGFRHDAILHFMLANPTVSKAEVAIRFNVTSAWLSTIINSQAFIEARALYTEVAFHETVLPLREKMVHAADLAMDRMIQLTPQETDLDTVRKTAESVLGMCGFSAPRVAPGSTTNIQQNNHFHGNASPEVLARARAAIGRPSVVIEGNANGTAALIESGGGAGDSSGRLADQGTGPSSEEEKGGGEVSRGDEPRVLAAEDPRGSRPGIGGEGRRAEEPFCGNFEEIGRPGESLLSKRVQVMVLCGGEPL